MTLNTEDEFQLHFAHTDKQTKTHTHKTQIFHSPNV